MDELDQIKPSEPGPPCGISVILDGLSEPDRDALNAVLFEPKPRVHPHRDLQKFLISKGHSVSYSSVTLHRLKQCRCFTGKSARMKASAS
jgi:hypothetical protein